MPPEERATPAEPGRSGARANLSANATASVTEWVIAGCLAVLSALSIAIVFGDDLGQLFGREPPGQPAAASARK
jgi:hypothetical protein